MWHGGDLGTGEEKEVRAVLELVTSQPESLVPHFEAALDLLVKIVESDEDMSSDIDVALKSTLLDGLISKELHT